MSVAKSRLSVFDRSFKEEKDYWVKKFERDVEVTELATDFVRPSDGAVETNSFDFALFDDVALRLAKLAGDSPFLIYAALLAGLQVCLQKYTGARITTVGSPAREKDGAAPTNALAIINEVDSNAPFRTLLMSVREALIEAYAKQNYPYERLLRDLDLDGITNRSPLFGVTAALKNIHGELPPLNVDLALTFTKSAKVISGRLEYNSKLFRQETLERFVGHYLNVLTAVTGNINVLVRDIQILSEAEQQQLLVDWNDTTAPRPKHSCLHEMFAAQVEREPDAIAVETAGERISYRELDERANRLAAYLISRGVRLEDRVGVCLERSVEMIVAILGVLKAGAAYLPLDPAYPQERLAFMIQDADVKLLLTAETLATDYADFQSGSFSDPPLKCSYPQNAAYVIYTSGSTGQPKGVVVPHGGVCNMVAAQTRAFAVQPESRVLQFASFSFDASVSEIFMALTVGATLYLADRTLLAAPESLTQLLNEQKITTVTLPPTVLALLDPNDFPTLKTLITAGEACSAAVATAWSKGRRFFNAYGPTEASVCATMHLCDEADVSAPPIGRPISNMRVYILNRDLQPVPAGVTGELYIGGDGLARGYLSQPELTAEKFVPDRFSGEPGEKLYRSGDLCRWLPSGEIEFVGRVDKQVKLRGFRIELGEIEAVLRTHAAVRESVVVVNDAGRDDKRLVAYVVAEPRATTGNELRTYLKERLPEYMVPSVFMLLEELPLTASGKVDHRRLPEPEGVRPELAAGYVAPTTAVEELVAGMWAEVLGLERVGVNDNFFDLGGHSLVAIQVISRVRETFQVELKLDKFFATPTVSALAKVIAAAQARGEESKTQRITPVGRELPLPLSYAQQRLWFIDQLEPGNPFYNIPSAIRLRGNLNVAALERSFNEIVRRHETLRSNFLSQEGQPVQVVAPARPLKLEVIDLQPLPEAERETEAHRLAMADALCPFNLAHDALLRVTLLRLTDKEHVVLVTMHHIVSDGWSMGLLIKEVAVCYATFSVGRPALLEPLPIQYGDFAVWQRDYLQGENLEQLLSYWRKQLAGLPTLELPTDHQRPAIQSLRGAYQVSELPSELIASIDALSRKEGVSTFMMLLAVFNTLLYRYTGQTDIVVGTDAANRNRVETEGLIGFFLNHLVLRTDLSGEPTFLELLARVRGVSLGAFAHQDMPFDLLVKALKPKRDLSHTPLFQVLFVVQNAPMPSFELPELSLSTLEADNGTTKFDLSLFITESAAGLHAIWKYSADIFYPETIKRMADNFQKLLEAAVADPSQTVTALTQRLNDSEREQQLLSKQQRQQSKIKKLAGIRRKSINLEEQKLVETELLNPEFPMPLVIRALAADVDPFDWATANRTLVQAKLREHGALLFRDFQLSSVTDFERFADLLCRQLFGEYGDLPREGVSNKVYGATPYPADQPILFHNESSHLQRWPMKIFFFCVQPPLTGGETPIVDCRRVLQLLSPSLRRRLQEKGLTYVRNFAPAIDVSWQDFFHTTHRQEVERKCVEAGTEFEWIGDEGLRTWQHRDAITRHPFTGEEVFFNQVQLHHPLSLSPDVRNSLLEIFGEAGLPRNVVYGNGEPISDEDMAEIGRAYDEAAVLFNWQRGDVALLDNMLVAHGRKPYSGERKIVVAMGELIEEHEVSHKEAQKAQNDLFVEASG
ncbi:MAG TPA: amino acid adenylation domain-containing protein [Pyrinomonadaceae bacterium]|nr:amino acid adenylation domain-containing protein [Pyrinomonadaceae bacterium]